METVSLKLEEPFLKDMEKTMKKHRYMTKTEFIREAIRDKMKSLALAEDLRRIQHMYGFRKRKTTDEEIEEAKEKAFEELEKKFK